jgi:hypothetical protein
VRGRDALVGERASDLAEASAPRVFQADSFHDALRKRRRPTRRTSLRTSARRLEVLSNESLELCDRNEPLPPRRLVGGGAAKGSGSARD